eukprot:11173898-Lingulodinium_polyedra.AAC.1
MRKSLLFGIPSLNACAIAWHGLEHAGHRVSGNCTLANKRDTVATGRALLYLSRLFQQVQFTIL